MDIPRPPHPSDELQAELQRLEREIEELRERLAQEAEEERRRARPRRLARTSRADSQHGGSRGLRVIPGGIAPVTSLADARARAEERSPRDDDEGPQAA